MGRKVAGSTQSPRVAAELSSLNALILSLPRGRFPGFSSFGEGWKDTMAAILEQHSLGALGTLGLGC